MRNYSVFIIFLLSSIFILGAANEAATVATTCPTGKDTLFRLSSPTNAHGAIYTELYSYKVCSPYTIPGASHTCATSGSNIILRLSDTSNAHAETAEEENYDIAICYADFSCTTVNKPTTGTGCSTTSVCIASLSENTNAHLGACNDYDINICCSSQQGTGTDQYPQDPCSFQDLGDQCGEISCNTDTDNDEAYTDTTEIYGCDLAPKDPCSTYTFKDNCDGQGCDLTDTTTNNYEQACSITTCGDDIDPAIDTGENCAVCSGDAGCNNGQTCCLGTTTGTATCQTTTCAPTSIFPGCTFGLTQNATGTCICKTAVDDYCPTDQSCQTTDPDCSENNNSTTCSITSASWTTTTANEGATTQLRITTNAACNTKTATFRIFEDDLLIDDQATTQPATTTITAGTATTTWTAEYAADTGSDPDPEYYFTVTIATTAAQAKSSNLIKISRSSGTAVCGNNRIDTGENCKVCSKDAGCGNNQLCCESNTTISCQVDSCSTGSTPVPPTDPTGCAPGLKKDTAGKCICNEGTKDGTCPKVATGCFFKDKDCDDGDGKNEGDNCPTIKNTDQADLDQDFNQNTCKFDIIGAEGYGVIPNLQLCGGDLCDLDKDGDEICDEPSKVPIALRGQEEGEGLCYGNDQCDNTPRDELLNVQKEDYPAKTQGCSEEQATCLVQWDCSTVTWGECTQGIRTRNIGDCSETGITAGQCKCEVTGLTATCRNNNAYRPPTEESCSEEAQQENFPAYDWINALITLVLIAGFYSIKKKH
ncbi:MAG: hypothetical protein Q7R96_01285 [Nanoarchaeota archaeon]|nr:hypothetical protein [Nanoarchaeota archaeon]